MVLYLEIDLRFGYDLIMVGSPWVGSLEAGRSLIRVYYTGVVRGPGVKYGTQMFNRRDRCPPSILHHLEVGDMYVHIKYSSSSGLGGRATPILEGYD